MNARGFRADALNGDIPQNTREKIVDKLKRGKIDVLLATDVAARGLDVERISHVINYDIPYDTESYVHRIGRTGRAGREGHAILFVSHREKRMLKAIERATNQPIEEMHMPTIDAINETRVERFATTITETLASQDLQFYTDLVEKYVKDNDQDWPQLAAALAKMAAGDELLLKERPRKERESRDRDDRRDDRRDRKRDRNSKDRPRRENTFSAQAQPLADHPDVEMERYRIELGRNHDVKVGSIVGAIANEADIDSEYIGRIDLFDEFTTVDLPAGMPKEVQSILAKARVAGKPMQLAPIGKQEGGKSKPKPKDKDKGKPKAKKRKPKS